MSQSGTHSPAYSSLDRPVQFLKGVGAARADLLRRLGLLTARDVLYHVPHRYEDASTLAPIGSLVTGMDASVVGRVVSSGVLPTRRGLRIFQAVLQDSSGAHLECSWPGQPYLERVIHRGELLLVSGPIRFFHGKQMQPREFTVIAGPGEQGPEEAGVLFPVYPATEGLSHRQVRKLVQDNLDDLLRRVREEEDAIPAAVLERAGVEPLWRALEHLHRPTSLEEAERGRRRLAFEELFYLQLLHARTRQRTVEARRGIAFARKDFLVQPFHAALPFALTGAQKRALKEIGADMAAPKRMNRLLQGDVGSGKTVVAAFAMLRAVENGYQAALMAPTEILAEQHARTLNALVKDLPVDVTLLTGRLGARQRREALYRIASGGVGWVVGTHALIQESVQFRQLGLVVVDEQHRFGVKQRLALAELGEGPDMLVMSATPIPRSLALTLYGDLEVSVLDERPPGRQPVRTALRPEEGRERVLEFVRAEVARGRQAYFVYPLVEESEKVDLKSASEEFQRLKSEIYPELRVALVHGQMHGDEKDAVMRAFAAGEVDVLVSTTVIEVGIDVPNATVMVVEHAERFGLSQLHQLRGRVGRGAETSYCVLLAGGFEGRERLKLFESTDDGFKIAEFDMRQRGYGDLFGARQTGIPELRFADLERDAVLVERAREEARRLVESDPGLEAHPRLQRVMEERYGERARMYHVG